MKYELKKLNMNMGITEYEMYQDIPLKESGLTNLCNGLPYEAFKNYLENQLARKYQNISEYDTPTVTYIMYVNDIPLGYICLRTKIDDLLRRNIRFENMCAEGQTKDGQKFIESFLNLKGKSITNEGYKLYSFDNAEEMNEWIYKFPKYIEKYNANLK